jgi:hypothetical protein
MPSSSGTWHTVKRSAQLIDIIRVLIITRRSRDINFPIIAVSWEQITLNECLTDIHVVTMHIILRRKGENHAETAGMRDRAESVLKVPTSLFSLSMHMLTFDNETHLALFHRCDKVQLIAHSASIFTCMCTWLLWGFQARAHRPHPGAIQLRSCSDEQRFAEHIEKEGFAEHFKNKGFAEETEHINTQLSILFRGIISGPKITYTTIYNRFAGDVSVRPR